MRSACPRAIKHLWLRVFSGLLRLSRAQCLRSTTIRTDYLGPALSTKSCKITITDRHKNLYFKWRNYVERQDVVSGSGGEPRMRSARGKEVICTTSAFWNPFEGSKFSRSKLVLLRKNVTVSSSSRWRPLNFNSRLSSRQLRGLQRR